MKLKLLFLILLIAASSFAQQKPWRQVVSARLPYFGDGNWIVVADSTFALRSSPGIEMIRSDDSHLDTVRQLLDLLAKDGHVRPIIYTDAELRHVPEQDAPGIEAYRQLFTALLEKFFPQDAARTVQHFSMLQRLDDTAKSLNVLVIKTSSPLPYTCVFLELKPGNWSDDAEQRLRQSIQ